MTAPKPNTRSRLIGLVVIALVGVLLCLAVSVYSAFNARTEASNRHVEVMDGSVSCETTSGRDYVRVSGRVQNVGEVEASAIEVTLIVYDGSEVARATTYAEPDTLAPGQRGLFEGSIVIAGANWNKCVARVSGSR